MIGFHQLSDDDPALSHSPLLRAAQLTLQYAQDHGPIGLTKTGAFKRVFVHWAAENFNWPGFSRDELFEVNKVLNEYDFPPLELLHFILVQMKLARHYKGEFRVTKRGAELLKSPAELFTEVIPFFLFEIDHVAYWTCHAYVPVSELFYAAFRSNAKGLLPPSDECLRLGL
ncbi:hypothetical protein [Octadecabacter antarcticus]|uniref:hypothetical protein n=1 Tax=Octadecabacter antarcticus TaxID=1217908 RepID=UPI00165121D7